MKLLRSAFQIGLVVLQGWNCCAPPHNLTWRIVGPFFLAVQSGLAGIVLMQIWRDGKAERGK
jgi:hypothetical protein